MHLKQDLVFPAAAIIDGSESDEIISVEQMSAFEPVVEGATPI
jgi:hypothetical protein